MEVSRTLLGDGPATVIGLPSDFELDSALKSAREIRLATAFAHRSGWKKIKMSVSSAAGKVLLLTGLDCFQTEPEVLKEWLDLKLLDSNRVQISLASRSTFFHPKVLIVSSDSPHASFAVVGSGNLSLGGLQTNSECSLFVKDESVIDQLLHWFDGQFASGIPLIQEMITAYEPKYKKNKTRRLTLAKQQDEIDSKLKSVATPSLKQWKDAVRAAQTYFHTQEFQDTYESRRKGAERILGVLNVPDFNFNRSDWNEFYSIRAFGKLDERYRDKVFKSQKRLRAALRALINNGEKALPEVLSRGAKLHVSGMGLNTVSKILTAYAPQSWQVFNARVAKALADFGYKSPRGAGAAGRYLAYRNTMSKFIDACKVQGVTIDGLALDAFFYYWSKQLEGKRE